MKDLSVLIVGGGAGLGALLAEMAVEAGAAKIGIIDINQEAAESALATAKARGLPTATALCDIQVGPQCHAAFEAIVSKLGRVDTLINCAAIYPRRPLLEITDADWDASNGINIKGTYHMMVAAVRHMQSQEPKSHVRGRIVNLTSVDAFKAHPQNAHYAATKAAVVSLTRSFAHHVAKDGILVNSVAPAGMATEKAKALGFLEELAKASPLGRGAEPKEIAEWVLMTGSPKNTYMTGENVIVSGGYIYA
ncbi:MULTISPECIES: SDR family oxidoreductase [unclassified Mesorhizobium]|jgi:NAD(P)-dependent dehydrogenase (short-subunit alcohol dehydrogenase family)|uniref:SDR family NAD(P)-dependent oxidoreductase n=1 Tax=unclassified Mesorhizobium TaxID=325217 RepID=UPI000FCA9435|nr:MULTISPECIES: SDR family oxidoreductase [unclassified Mesorhizobium]RUU65060.1 SDR family oxidoreductase [Mesorhizobium sp. M7A.T.Ca.TU.009.01.1.1]RUU77440.1 SDR family oxidoreductase [Mesorhizobium sp. M7A.T.Ca.TU.009.01.1.2]MCQ8870594.1 SDR family oxidoreductase [Mesorhizobium sp. LMG17149]RUT89676.1 SDR family oxidoreductase [Mesorhizobium sp. M7A.T.Ca.US.000.02.1.1]RUT93528.1 SDR family oxidoreductase [Mesorhizobium sp. M7A.T.Ca.US.000.02.2.1]